jgi:alpha-beta hydrolase superfamily lysophospholipase
MSEVPLPTEPAVPIRTPSSRASGAALKQAIKFSIAIALLYGALVAAFYVGQEKIIFRPSVLPPSHQFTLPDVTEVSIPVDGAVLSALHFRQPNAKGLVFYLHGNGGNLATWVRNTDFYRSIGYDLFMIDYRGYGKSTGRITSEAQLHQDVMTSWQFIAPQYADKKKVIFGRSLGTALAARLSTQVQADLTVLVSPFTNLDDLRGDLYPFLPRGLMRYPMPTDQWLPQAKSPVTILHGTADELISVEHARRLKAIAPVTELIEIETGTHNNLHHLPRYVTALSARIAKL